MRNAYAALSRAVGRSLKPPIRKVEQYPMSVHPMATFSRVSSREGGRGDAKEGRASRNDSLDRVDVADDGREQRGVKVLDAVGKERQQGRNCDDRIGGDGVGVLLLLDPATVRLVLGERHMIRQWHERVLHCVDGDVLPSVFAPEVADNVDWHFGARAAVHGGEEVFERDAGADDYRGCQHRLKIRAALIVIERVVAWQEGAAVQEPAFGKFSASENDCCVGGVSELRAHLGDVA
eukprot:scaffold128323_cov27-Tisochrysis_lutea.AAC.4